MGPAIRNPDVLLIEETGDLFDRSHTGVFCFSGADVLDGAKRHPRVLLDFAPAFLGVAQLAVDVLVEGVVHALDCMPRFGKRQTRFGDDGKLGYSGMPQKIIKPPFIAELQAILADNVRILMEHEYGHLGSEGKMVEALRKDAGVGRGTVNRMLIPPHKPPFLYPGVDKIALVARAFKATTVDLLSSGYAMRRLGNPSPEQRKHVGHG